MNYKEALKYLDSFVNYEKIIDYPYNSSLNLERMKSLCKFFDNPQEKFKSIHITGTKGKGSVAAMLGSILKENSLKVGLYTSPHLISPRERIRVLDNRLQAAGYRPQVDLLNMEGMISEEEIILLIEEVKPAIEKIQQDESLGEVSFFEIYTILAFLYFARRNVDIAVLEAGMGGRLDATNVVRPLVVVFTPISFDHTDKLGPELLDIAREKAGIIKSHKSQVTSHKPVVISAPQEKVVIDVIRKRCKQTGARLYEENKDFFYEKTGDGFKIKGIFNEYPELKISLLGKYQLINAALAVGIIEALHSCNIKVNINSIRRGLYSVVWPGRMQVIEKSPFFIVDGAQNRASAKALKESLKDFSFDSLILLLGISANKDIAGITQELCPQARQVILTKANNPRAAQPEIFEKIVKKYCRNTKLTGSTEEGLITARQAASKDDLILATGSFYLVGEILKTQIHLRGVFGFCEGI